MNQVLELTFMALDGKDTDTSKKLSVIKIKHPATMLDRETVYEAMKTLASFDFLLNAKGESMKLGTPYMATMAVTNKQIIFDSQQKAAA